MKRLTGLAVAVLMASALLLAANARAKLISAPDNPAARSVFLVAAAPKKAAPKKPAPKKAAPKKTAPKKAAPKKETPKKAAPK